MKTLFTTLSLVALLTLSSCSVESVTDIVDTNSTSQSNVSALTCTDADPVCHLTNNGTAPFTLNVFDNNGVLLISAIDVQPGTNTNIMSFAAGEILFSFDSNTDGVSDVKQTIDMVSCTQIDFTIDTDNNLIVGQTTNL